MKEQPSGPEYHAYLLRLWHEERAGWRASLEEAHTGERHSFATLERLFHFLTEQTTQVPGHEADSGP